jgi:pimeloyl-ACP methyl ester carboxylesterase
MNTSPTDPGNQDPDASPPGTDRHGFSRRGFVGVAAATGMSLFAASASAAAAPNGEGSLEEALRHVAGFAGTFDSRFVQANGIRQHVVIGGDGPPLLLIHGWPEDWFAWRLMMPALAKQFTVIAVDQRGIGRSEKAATGYDAATLANDQVALMDALGYDRFAVAGHDTGYIVAYALASDHSERVARLIVAEIPGPPVIAEGPPLFLDDAGNNRLWHIPFNRVDDELIINMVRSNAEEYYRYEYNIQGGGWTPPEYAIQYYIHLYNRNRDTLRASFGFYRAWGETSVQNKTRTATMLTMPVLGIGGEKSWGPLPGDAMRPIATDVQTVVVPGAGHWVAEQAPEVMVEAFTSFLAPYRAGG